MSSHLSGHSYAKFGKYMKIHFEITTYTQIQKLFYLK